jgi:hypothetical protein
MGDRPARPRGTPIEEGRRRLEAAGFTLITVDWFSDRGELWRTPAGRPSGTVLVPLIDEAKTEYLTSELERFLAAAR